MYKNWRWELYLKCLAIVSVMASFRWVELYFNAHYIQSLLASENEYIGDSYFSFSSSYY